VKNNLIRYFGIMCCILIISACTESEESKKVKIETSFEADSSQVEKPNNNDITLPQSDIVVAEPNGKHLEYHPNGQLKIKGQYNAKKERTGLWVSYYD